MKSKINLDKEHQDSILYEIELLNLSRIKIMLVILFVIQIMFIIFNDLHHYFSPTAYTIWRDSGYFIVHLLLLSTCVIGFIVANKLVRLEQREWKRLYYNFTSAMLVIYLVLISLLNALDQMHINNVSTLFTANLLICGGFFILNFPKNLVTYTIPFLCCMSSYFYLHLNNNVIISNLINDLIFFISVIIISSSIYYYQYERIAENIILENTNKRLNYISNHDPLTGLLNRGCFMEQLEKKLLGKMEPSSIVLADIDYFKNVNDHYGHPIGDLVLQQVSIILIKHMREGDLAVRWGGEEFLLFFHDTSLQGAYELTEEIRKAIEEMTLQINNIEIRMTASFGIASLKNDGENSFNISYKNADAALYQAKAQGRNCVVYTIQNQ